MVIIQKQTEMYKLMRELNRTMKAGEEVNTKINGLALDTLDRLNKLSVPLKQIDKLVGQIRIKLESKTAVQSIPDDLTSITATVMEMQKTLE